MKVCQHKWFFALLLLVFIVVKENSSYANEITHLNVGRVAINDQSVSAQEEAGKEAFEQVLVKLSGNKSILQNELLSRSSRSYIQYLVSSSFVNINGSLTFQASFAQDKMIELLQFAGVPVWGNLRPKTTVWLAYKTEDNQQINVINQLSAHPWLSKIADASYQRGVELLVPVGDLDDSVNVSQYDVWGLFAPSIARYSSKFNNEYTLVARIGIGFDEFSSKEAYIAEWIVVSENLIYSSKSSGGTLDTALENLLSDYTDYLASRHAISSELLANSKTLEIELTGVDNLSKYAAVVSALEGIAVVSDVSLKEQTQESLLFSLSINANEDALISVLALDGRFMKYQTDEMSEYTVLRYTWEGQ